MIIFIALFVIENFSRNSVRGERGGGTGMKVLLIQKDLLLAFYFHGKERECHDLHFFIVPLLDIDYFLATDSGRPSPNGSIFLL